MKILGLNITRNQNSKTPIQKSFDSAAWLAGEDLNSTYRAPSLSSPYEQVTWAYRAINAIGEQIANIPFLFTHGERGREHLITSGPLIDFYDQPHPHINRFQYWELRILWLMLRGECFRIPIYDEPLEMVRTTSTSSLASSRPPIANQNSKFKNGSTQLKAVLILSPDNFQAIIKNHLLVGWRYTGFPQSTPLESQVFLPEEVWYDKLPNPFDFWRGLSPLSAASLALKTDFAASSFMHAFMDNNADNGLIIRTNEQLDDSQRQQVLSALRNRKGRAGSPDRPLLLWNNCEIVKPTLSAVDLQFLENRKFSRGEICAALGVPEEIVASTDHNKYDVMQGARLNFIENRIAPLCARLEASERATIRALDPNAIGWFDLDSLPIMQQARRDRLATAKLGFDMGIPFNELNRVLDLGFQPLANGNTGYLPTNLQPTTTLTETKKSPTRQRSGHLPHLPVTHDSPIKSMKPKSLGKISQLPASLREQVNHRIYNGDPHNEILTWLNTLPEVRKLIVEEYGGKPISKQNFSEWVQNGYRHWRLRQDALAFASNLDEDDEAIQAAFDGSIANKLSRWASLNYAAAAQSLSAKDAEADPEANFRRLHDLCLDIAVLRRGDLSAARIAIEEKRLAIELEHNQKEKEQEFWQWTQRPDVQAKLYPHRDPDKIRRDVDDLISERLLGSRRQSPTPETNEDPSCLI